MANSHQDAVETFTGITGASEAVALQKLEEHAGNLTRAINAYFSEGDRTNTRKLVSQNDFMAIDDPVQDESQGPSQLLLPSSGNLNSFSPLDTNLDKSFIDGGIGTTDITGNGQQVLHPTELRGSIREFKDDRSNQSGHSGLRPAIEDVTGSAHSHGPENHGIVVIEDEVDEDLVDAPTDLSGVQNERETVVYERHSGPSAPQVDNNMTDNVDDIEEEMLQAAIEASKRDVEEGYPKQNFGAPNDSSYPRDAHGSSHSADFELARAVSLSLKTAEQEKALRTKKGVVGTSEQGDPLSSGGEELGNLVNESGRQGFGLPDKETPKQFKLEEGNSSAQEAAEDAEEHPLVRNRSRRISFGAASDASGQSTKEVGEPVDSLPSSPVPHDVTSHPQPNGDPFHSDEWGGISSEEHDEAVMLEAAMFGGIPEGTTYHRFGYPLHNALQTGLDGSAGLYPRPVPRPPSPTIVAQRLLREQQDDEYLAALRADKEKELKAMEEAEIRRFEEAAAREAALHEERQREEEARRKLLEEEEFERRLVAKEASLPLEPAVDDELAVTLLVRMPDGSRRGRRFLKSDKLQSLFDFMDIGRVVKPSTYRLVRPYPRRAFSERESGLSLSDLGLTSKQEALFLELI